MYLCGCQPLHRAASRNFAAMPDTKSAFIGRTQCTDAVGHGKQGALVRRGERIAPLAGFEIKFGKLFFLEVHDPADFGHLIPLAFFIGFCQKKIACQLTFAFNQSGFDES